MTFGFSDHLHTQRKGTTKEYTVSVYTHFDVNHRAELLASFALEVLRLDPKKRFPEFP
jgi:hypothetical protein